VAVITSICQSYLVCSWSNFNVMSNTETSPAAVNTLIFRDRLADAASPDLVN
jgi:hypothetical protein